MHTKCCNMNQEVLSQAGHSIFSVYSNFLCNIILEIPSMCLLPLPDLNMRLNRPAGVEVLQNLQNQSDLIICTFGLKKHLLGSHAITNQYNIYMNTHHVLASNLVTSAK